MKFQKLLLGLTLVGSITLASYAADTGVTTSGTASQQYQVSRWSISKFGAEALTPATTVTNVVSSVPSVIGKIFFNPSTINDSFKVYNASTAANATTANIIFEANANSPINGNSPVNGMGVPLAFDLLPGWSATSGITILTTRPNTAAAAKGYISYDQVR